MEKSASKPSRPKLSRRRQWLFRLVAVVLSPLLFFTLLEIGLRLGGYGYATSFFIGPEPDGTYTTNHQYGWRFFPHSVARYPNPCFISAKPAGAVRIFVLGGSAAQGIPDPSFSFGRILELMLRERYPGVRFEIVNAAMTAINSHVTRDIARYCTAYQPDLFVVYMGNNEVVGPYGPGTVFQRWSPSLPFIRAGIWVKSMRTGQLMSDVLGSLRSKKDSLATWQGMEMFLGNQVSADDPRLAAVYDNYRQNLIDICDIAQGVGAAVVLSTVAVNLKNCPPLASLHRSDLSNEDLTEWKALYRDGIELESAGQWEEAMWKYEAAERIDGRYAELLFRMGRCLEALGRMPEARDRFLSARDLDALRFRADTRINAIIREVAEQKVAEVHLADAEKSLAKSPLASDGKFGGDLFYEHVHLTFDGNYLLARTVMEEVAGALAQLAPHKQGPVLSRQQCREMLTMTPWDEYQMARQMAEMTARPPFTNQLDHALRQASAQERVEELERQETTPEALASACRAYEGALKKTPDDIQLHYRFAKLAMKSNRPETAVTHLQAVLKKLPREPEVYADLGKAEIECGRINQAIEHFRQALEINPESATARCNIGLSLAGCGRIDEAIAQYEQALKINPKLVIAHNGLGEALTLRGQINKAIDHYQKALEIDPEYATAHSNLGNALSNMGQIDKAIAHYKQALKINPKIALAHYNLGVILTNRGRNDEAVAHYQKALEIDPKMPMVHNNLGIILASRGQLDKAIAHFQKALEITPDDRDARINLEKALKIRAQGLGQPDSRQ